MTTEPLPRCRCGGEPMLKPGLFFHRVYCSACGRGAKSFGFLTNREAIQDWADMNKPEDLEAMWVIQDRVPARPGIDERAWTYGDEQPSRWSDAAYLNFETQPMHGHGSCSQVLHLRCRRKDLPATPEPPQNKYVGHICKLRNGDVTDGPVEKRKGGGYCLSAKHKGVLRSWLDCGLHDESKPQSPFDIVGIIEDQPPQTDQANNDALLAELESKLSVDPMCAAMANCGPVKPVEQSDLIRLLKEAVSRKPQDRSIEEWITEVWQTIDKLEAESNQPATQATPTAAVGADATVADSVPPTILFTDRKTTGSSNPPPEMELVYMSNDVREATSIPPAPVAPPEPVTETVLRYDNLADEDIIESTDERAWAESPFPRDLEWTRIDKTALSELIGEKAGIVRKDTPDIRLRRPVLTAPVAPPEPLPLKLEYGKRYVREDGVVKGPMRKSEKDQPSWGLYRFTCEISGDTFTEAGVFAVTTPGSGRDVVAEYVEPVPVHCGGPYVEPVPVHCGGPYVAREVFDRLRKAAETVVSRHGSGELERYSGQSVCIDRLRDVLGETGR